MDKTKTNDLLYMAEQVINQSHYTDLAELNIIPLDEHSQTIRAEDDTQRQQGSPLLSS